MGPSTPVRTADMCVYVCVYNCTTVLTEVELICHNMKSYFI